VFDALWRGLTVRINDFEYKLSEIQDMTLHNFIKLCQTASDEEISIICDQITINKQEGGRP
jgi:hypothetical protein